MVGMNITGMSTIEAGTAGIMLITLSLCMRRLLTIIIRSRFTWRQDRYMLNLNQCSASFLDDE